MLPDRPLLQGSVLPVEDGTDWLHQNIGNNYHFAIRNFQKYRKSHPEGNLLFVVYTRICCPVLGKVSIVLDLEWHEPRTNSTADILAAERAIQFEVGVSVDTVCLNTGIESISLDRHHNGSG
jgi:hypothetical protein